MNPTRKLKTVILAGTLVLFGQAIGSELSLPVPSFITTAEARVGRPLTPVSVAGVARRTVRRCAVGVYYC
jgi:hypothetical protein